MAECTAHDPSLYVPFVVAGAAMGAVRRDRLPLLDAHDDLLDSRYGRVALRDASTSDERTRHFARLAERLAAEGHVPRLLGERYAVAPRFGADPLLLADRAAIPFFGLRAHGVHLHGVVHRAAERWLWIARRARDRTTFPGMLDNMVAGGQPHGLTLRENLLKECHEEAGIPAALAGRAVATGAVHYRVDVPSGLRDDVLFLYELELPDDFVPTNTDGEVESFELLPVAEVLRLVTETREFKFNCNLALIDYFLRHGDVGPGHAEHAELLRLLQRPGPDEV